MKRLTILHVALLSAIGTASAQETLSTYSVYDVNHHDGTTVSDVTSVASRLAGKETSEPQTANANVLNSKLLELKHVNTQINLYLNAMEERLGLDKDKTQDTAKTTDSHEYAEPQTLNANVLNSKLLELKYVITQINLRFNAMDMRLGLDKDKPTNIPQTINNHEFIDLGLRNANGRSVLWATCNVGASSPEEAGDYFAWGETVPYYAEGHSQDNPCTTWRSIEDRTITGYNWESYKFGKDQYFTKYSAESRYGKDGFTDRKTVLDPEDDAATVNWGSRWRTPTAEDFDLLLTNCYWVWVDTYYYTTVNGYVVYKAKDDSDKGKIYDAQNPPTATYSEWDDTHIFLPAAGGRNYGNLYDAGTHGDYLSSTLHNETSSFYRTLYLSSSSATTEGGLQRIAGSTVRPVCVSY